ncbi:MAG: lysylphosphatidylglycerol synthase transmembrane domain-containing protein [Pirellulales bacterium]
MNKTLKKTLIYLLKFGISAAIIAYLVVEARADKTFSNLASQPKDWPLLGLAWALCLAAVALTIVRWFVLVRALELPFSLKDAFRLGFLGYLLNFVSLGSVGGDLFKAVFIAREHPGRRAEAVATVVLDRVIGLFMLFVLATAAILLTGQLHSPVREVEIIGRSTLMCTCIGAAGLLMLLVPGFTNGAISRFLENLPRVGPTFGKLIGAIRIYRSRRGVLAAAALLSAAVHVLSSVGIYLVARGLPGQAPTLAEHFVIVPLAMVTGVLPLPVNGLGAFEAVVAFLYQRIASGAAVTEGQGLVVALGYRAITIAIALVGVCFYLTSRREVATVLKEAELEAERSDLHFATAHPGAAAGSGATA